MVVDKYLSIPTLFFFRRISFSLSLSLTRNLFHRVLLSVVYRFIMMPVHQDVNVNTGRSRGEETFLPAKEGKFFEIGERRQIDRTV